MSKYEINAITGKLDKVSTLEEAIAFNDLSDMPGGDISVGAATVTSLTDSTATLSGGNLTGMGNITGTDVDISAGTGDYTSTGDISVGAITGTSLTNSVALTLASTGAGVNINTHTDATDDFAVNTSMLVVEGDTGNVGIGTTSPGALLEVNPGPTTSSTVIFKGTSGTDGRYIFSAVGGTTANRTLTFTGTTIQSTLTSTAAVSTLSLQPNGGNVGIGTTAPSEKLTVAGNIHMDTSEHTSFTLSRSGMTPKLHMGITTGVVTLGASYDNRMAFQINENATANSLVLNNGNVGIGTTGPSQKLEVQGRILAVNAGSDGLKVADALAWTGTLGLRYVDTASQSTSYGQITVGDASNWRALALNPSGGNVGIGTTTPNQKLTIEGTLSLKEQASANADTAAYGQLWVKTATPNQLWFTDDAGNDTQLGQAGGTGDLKADGTVPLTADWDVGAFDITAVEFKGNLVGTINTAAQPNITSLGTITSLVATTADINAGTFDGIVGGTTPADGSFTTLSATGDVTLSTHLVGGDATSNPTNLLTNGDFELWSAGTSSAPDGWTLNGAGASVAREATIIKLGTYSAKITNANAVTAYVYQDFSASKGLTYWKGKKVTAIAWVWADTANRVRISISDGVVGGTSSFHTGDSTWQKLTVTATMDAGSSIAWVYTEITAGSVISAYFDGAMLVEGAMPYAFSPKPLNKINPTGFGAFNITGTGNFTGALTAASYTDNTPFYDGDALTAIKTIKGENGEIDHNTLPEFAKSHNQRDKFEEREVIGIDGETYIEKVKVGKEEVIGRNLGNMISILTKAVQQLTDRIEKLEAK